MTIFFFAVFLRTMVTVYATVNISNLSLPLLDKMAASLTANIDMTDMKSVIKDYIDQNVKEQVAVSLTEHVEKMKSEIQTSMLGL